MRISVNYKELKGALQVLSKAKIYGGLSADSYLYISADAYNGTTIEAVGEDVFHIKIHLAATMEVGGFATIRHCELKKFVDGIKGYKGEVCIETDKSKNEAIVKVGAINQSFQMIEEGLDYKECLMPKRSNYKYLGGNELVAQVAKATKFADPKSMKAAIRGVMIDAKGEVIKVLSTDTKYLFMCETPKKHIDGFETFGDQLSAPNRFWELLVKLASTNEVAVMHSADSYTKGYLYAGTADIELFIPCFIDDLPNYEMIFPTEYECKTTIINTKSFADMLKMFDGTVRLNFSDHCKVGIEDVDGKKSAYVDNIITGGFELGEKTEKTDEGVVTRPGIVQDFVYVDNKRMVDTLETLGDLTIKLNGMCAMELRSTSSTDCVLMMPVIR